MKLFAGFIIVLANYLVASTEEAVSFRLPYKTRFFSGWWMQKPRGYWNCWRKSCENYGKVYSNSSGKCPSCRQIGDPC